MKGDERSAGDPVHAMDLTSRPLVVDHGGDDQEIRDQGRHHRYPYRGQTDRALKAAGTGGARKTANQRPTAALSSDTVATSSRRLWTSGCLTLATATATRTAKNAIPVTGMTENARAALGRRGGFELLQRADCGGKTEEAHAGGQ